MAERRVEKNKNTQTDKQASGEAETESTELLVVVTPELIQPSK
jgi:Flp pilus assembly secretin CpaC